MSNFSCKMFLQDHVSDLENELLLPYSHIIALPSKGIRNEIVRSFNHWLRIPEEKMNDIISIMEMFHNGTLIIDDIQDGTEVRRGVPASHCIYGVPWTTNTSLHVIFLVFNRCLNLGHPDAIKVCIEQSLELVRGQGKEIYWRDKFLCPTEAEYRVMTEQKTGAMLNIGVRLMQLFSDCSTDYSELVKKLAFFFQMRDDYCNISEAEKLEERPSDQKVADYYMDVSEGKFTIPIIHALRNKHHDAITSILKQRPTDVTMKRYFVSLLEEGGSLEYARRVLEEVEDYLRKEIARHGGNPSLENVLDQLTWDKPSTNAKINTT